MVAGPRNQNVFLFGDFLIAGNYEHVAGELLFRP